MTEPIAGSARALQQIVGGTTEGIILMDTHGSVTWANAAALRLHEIKTIGELGEDVKSYRQRFTLRYVGGQKVLKAGYPMEQALAGKKVERSVMQLFAHGDAEPIGVHSVHALTLGARDNVEGYAIVHEDITRQHEAEERFERTFSTNPAPALICRLSDQRFIKVNEGFLAMAHYSRNALLGRSIRETDMFLDLELRKMTQGCLDNCESIGQIETQIRTGDGQVKQVLVAGQPLEVADETCMLFTFVDLDPRRQVESALRASEELFSKAFQMAPVPMLVAERDSGRIVNANEAFMTVTHYKSEQWKGQTIASLKLWKQPAGLKALDAALDRGDRVRDVDALIATGDGDMLQCVVSAQRVRIGERDCALMVVQDVTQRKRNETELISAIDAVMQDTSWFSRTIIEKLAYLRRSGDSSASDAALADLTPRERDVLGAICQGMSDAEIATALGIAKNTVRNHTATLYEKIRVNRRSAAVVWARERGFTGERLPARRK
ncbi:MAG: PAS domain S-box protein [Comamonadaceae bacterium]|nr:MAG: PAS domain S-box protein [Comamonadaceae bacterium]